MKYKTAVTSGGDLCWRLGGTSAEGASSAVGERIERRRREDRGAEGGRVRARKGEFWCILGATFAVELNENWLGYCMACTD